MALTGSIYGTCGWQPGNWASSFYYSYSINYIYNINYILSCPRVRVYEKGLPGCQVATSERQVGNLPNAAKCYANRVYS